MPVWFQIPAAVIIGLVVAVITATAIAAKELGDWRALRLQFVVNNRSHNERIRDND
ncbi:hypothetical protein SRRS_06850 [Sporomusa rhizae]|uniref:hypothetical protein n=1 Tax=Sporomusa rhizae TaxID=357999 RepID=UPI00352B09B7